MKDQWKDPKIRESWIKSKSEETRNREKTIVDYIRDKEDLDPEFREHMVESRNRFAHQKKSIETREKLSKITKRQWESSDFREAMSEKTKIQWKDSDFRKMQTELASERSARMCKDPNSNWGKGLNAGSGGKYRKMYDGKWYKSGLETLVAEFSDKNNLPFVYEPGYSTYVVEGIERKYFIDFYYPRLNLYVEAKAQYGPFGYEENKSVIDTKLESVRIERPNSLVFLLLDTELDETLEFIRDLHSQVESI